MAEQITNNRDSLREDFSGLDPNKTVALQLSHRTIRRFTDEALTNREVETLLEVARHTATSSFYQQCTIIRVLNPAIRHEIYEASGQPYVDGTAGQLWIFVADVHRDAQIRKEAGQGPEATELASTFFAAVKDSLLAAQNVVVAAESMDLGTVYLGSIAGDYRRVIRALKLPRQTFPVLGLLIGHPAQAPQYKPRLPLNVTVGVDEYPAFSNVTEALREYDDVIAQYYDLRDENRRVDKFTAQIARKMGVSRSETAPLLAVIKEQGLALRDE